MHRLRLLRRIAIPMRRATLVAWFPAAVLLASLAASTLAGALGHRALRQAADARLAVTGERVADHVEAAIVSRLRALETAAAIDAAAAGDPGRERQRRATIEALARLDPELVWVGFAERSGRVSAAHRDVLAGADVSGREWWTPALRGPYLGGPPDARPLVPALAGGPRGGDDPPDPSRLLDLAVPLRRADGEPYGVLAAQVDVGRALAVRGRTDRLADPLEDVEVRVLERDGSALSGSRVRLGPPVGASAAGLHRGELDGRPMTFSVHTVDGDVVVSRLGWRVAVGRDPRLHEAAALRLLAWSVAGGAIIGALGAIAVAVGAGEGRPPA